MQAQDITEGKSASCATICLDRSGGDLQSRISNVIYEKARQGAMQAPGFPLFDPLIAAIRQGPNVDRTTTYRVTVQRHDQLLVLESLAKQWMQDPHFQERAQALIEAHNRDFAPDAGEFWAADARPFRCQGKYTDR